MIEKELPHISARRRGPDVPHAVIALDHELPVAAHVRDDLVVLHASAWIACLGADVSRGLGFAAAFALAIVAGMVVGRDRGLRRSIFLGLREAGLSPAVCSAGFTSRL